jgi:glycolate dehydrogenase FAD-binding subunit
VRTEEPASADEAAEVLRSAAAKGLSVRFGGGGTKLEWGNPVGDPDVMLSTRTLDRILEHNAADLTAVLEAGVPLATAQQVFAASGQMLALDPPLGRSEAATIGGVVATGDSGPLRHRYGGPRDLLLGMTVALSDGSVAKSGGKVIKNVAGYDLAKLFAGSFGTLGLILQMTVRLHPLPARRVTAIGSSDDPDALQRAAIALSHSPLELESLDLAWDNDSGTVLARCAGSAPEARIEDAVHLISEAGVSPELLEDDGEAWVLQRKSQRSSNGVVVRVSGLPSELSRIMRNVHRLNGSLVGRAGLGICWVRLPSEEVDGGVAGVEDLRWTLAPLPCVVLDAPSEVRDKVDMWGASDRPDVELMRRLKARFDPAGVCNPGVFVGGI